MKLAVLALAAHLASAASIETESIARLLDRRFADAPLAYLLIDKQSGEVGASRWQDQDRPIPLGSLNKPFVALAYPADHGYPEYFCAGKRDGCWLERGHGRCGISRAIAHSCNAYFRALAEDVSLADIALVARHFGLSVPPESISPAGLIGIGGEWRNAPLAMARAYRELALRAAEPGLAEIIEGIFLSAREGTGRGAGSGALAKTGTAPCLHTPRMPGDGYAVAITPRFVLLVQVHGVPGAKAATVVGRMLRVIDAGK